MPELLPGTQLGDFLIDNEIARGGSCIVYQAHSIHLSELMAAIKIPIRLLTSKGLAEFLNEARYMATLSHPFILPIQSVGEYTDASGVMTPYILLPLAFGSMETKIATQGRLDLSDVLTFAYQISVALDFAHTKGILHGDIKPANVLFPPSGDDVWLADFGSARSIQQIKTSASQQTVAGTFAYMAPEVWNHQMSTASDQYSLALMLYTCLTGEEPFLGPTLVDFSYQHKNSLLPELPPGYFPPNVTAAITEVLRRASSKKPIDRYPTVLDFYRAFQVAASDTLSRQTIRLTSTVAQVLSEQRIRRVPDVDDAERLITITKIMHMMTRGEKVFNSFVKDFGWKLLPEVLEDPSLVREYENFNPYFFLWLRLYCGRQIIHDLYYRFPKKHELLRSYLIRKDAYLREAIVSDDLLFSKLLVEYCQNHPSLLDALDTAAALRTEWAIENTSYKKYLDQATEN